LKWLTWLHLLRSANGIFHRRGQWAWDHARCAGATGDGDGSCGHCKNSKEIQQSEKLSS
jgi:hypothetical protein